MIKNIPKFEDFLESSLNYMNISWDMTFEIFKMINESIDEEDVDNFRKSQKYFLNTSLMLLSQSIELYIKSEICKIHPFLLINLIKGSIDSDFDEYHSIDAKDLLSVHDKITTKKLGNILNSTFENIRKKRNKIMHSAGKIEFNEAEILINIINLSQVLFQKSWLDLRRSYLTHQNNELFNDQMIWRINDEIDVCKNFLHLKDFKKYSGKLPSDIQLSCADCLYSEWDISNKNSFRLSKYLYQCLACNKINKVKRKACPECSTYSLNSEELCLSCEEMFV